VSHEAEPARADSTERAADALAVAARELLAVLLARVDGSECLLREVDAELDGNDVARFGRDLARASDEVDETGWLFGVLAAGLGADTLIERVERGGLSAVIDWAADAARRLGRELVSRDAPAPDLALAPRESQQLAFACAVLLVRAAACAEPGTRVDWRIEPSSRGWRVRVSVDLDDETEAWLGAFEGTETNRADGAFEWRVPAEWLELREP
jgi:hypothetical protein